MREGPNKNKTPESLDNTGADLLNVDAYFNVIRTPSALGSLMNMFYDDFVKNPQKYSTEDIKKINQNYKIHPNNLDGHDHPLFSKIIQN